MHETATASLDFPTVTAGRGSRSVPTQRPTRTAGMIEISREVTWTVPSKVAAIHPPVIDIVPVDRSEALCRAMNVVLASVALVVFLPLMLLIALAIKLTSHGAALYSQTRVGVDRRYTRTSSDDRRVYDHGGKPFTMWKFRTMSIDAEHDGRAVWAVKQDPRVTFVGAILRRTRLDELPQLYNVLRGEMNIVGPRPERPAIFADLRQSIPEYHMRQRVKPGITGWAQINQSYDACVDDVRQKVRYDLEYMTRQSIIEDLRIMSMTLPVMVLRRGGW
jgi:lipopolysaccharide/colanic/teichoic acid biosynthesis glycosyltransferase